MSSGDREWIERVLRMNACVVVAQARINVQANRILEIMEAREDTTDAEERFDADKRNLHLMRLMRDGMLDEIEGEV